MDRRWVRWCSAGRRPTVVASRLLLHGLSALQQARGFSDHQAGTNGSSHDRQLLLREFLHFSLYDKEQGYFTTRGAQSVGRLSEPIRFHTLLGREGYNYRLQQLYRELEVAWLTPVDIFQPWYGEALARHIVQRYGRLPVRLPSGRGGEGTPLRVMEVGGGTGTLAANVLGYLREKNPRLYRHIRYTALEISPQLAQMQRERLRREGHGAVHSVREGSALELATWGPCDDTPCFVLMTEVLDNLPHDRAVKLPEGTWHETVVHRPSTGGSSWRQHTRPLQDRLVQTVLEHQQQLAPPAGDAPAGPHSRSWMDAVLDFAAGVPAPSQPAAAAGEDMNEVFLPTACMQLLTTLMMARPRHHLVAADFFQLPDVRIHGHGAPLVADTRPSGGRDFDTYLLPPGSADIFFPTNFDLLSRLYAGAAAGAGLGRSCFAEHRSTAQFMHEYADTFRTQTATSYNPLLEDFTNTRIFVGSTL